MAFEKCSYMVLFSANKGKGWYEKLTTNKKYCNRRLTGVHEYHRNPSSMFIIYHDPS